MLAVHRLAARSLSAAAIASRYASSVIAVRDVPMMAKRPAGTRPRTGGRGGNQLALGEIAGRAEDHDRHRSSARIIGVRRSRRAR
jgi:hypothetical protein